MRDHRYYFLLILLVFPLQAVSQTAGRPATNPQKGWRLFTSREGAFSAALPGKPRYRVLKTRLESVEVDRHMYESDLGREHFGVTYIDLPPGYRSKLDTRMEEAAEGLAQQVADGGGKVLSRSKIQRHGCDGWEVTATSASAAYVAAREFASSSRLYMVVFGSDESVQNLSATGQRFMDSFVIEGGCQ